MPWARKKSRKGFFSSFTKVVYNVGYIMHQMLWGRESQMWRLLLKKLRSKQSVRQSGGIKGDLSPLIKYE